MNCWQCGVEPLEVHDVSTLGDTQPRHLAGRWPAGDHEHAEFPPAAAAADDFDAHPFAVDDVLHALCLVAGAARIVVGGELFLRIPMRPDAAGRPIVSPSVMAVEWTLLGVPLSPSAELSAWAWRIEDAAGGTLKACVT